MFGKVPTRTTKFCPSEADMRPERRQNAASRFLEAFMNRRHVLLDRTFTSPGPQFPAPAWAERWLRFSSFALFAAAATNGRCRPAWFCPEFSPRHREHRETPDTALGVRRRHRSGCAVVRHLQKELVGRRSNG